MVLHYLPSPSDAIREMARIVKPGGHLVIVEFVSHALDCMEQELGVIWKGFASDTIRDWFSAAGLVEIEIEERESLAQERDLPSTSSPPPGSLPARTAPTRAGRPGQTRP